MIKKPLICYNTCCHSIPNRSFQKRQIFSVKDAHFKSDIFLDEVKQNYTNLINQFVRDEKQKLQVFERGSMYLVTKKIGKNNPKAEESKAENKKRVMWNQTVDRAVVTGIARDEILQVKKRHITERIALSEKAYVNRPDKFSSIIGAAIAILEFPISKIFPKEAEAAGNAGTANAGKMQKTEPKELPKPKMPPKAALCHRLCDIDEKLKAQNRL